MNMHFTNQSLFTISVVYVSTMDNNCDTFSFTVKTTENQFTYNRGLTRDDVIMINV